MTQSRIIQKRCYYKSGIDETVYSEIIWQHKETINKSLKITRTRSK